MIWPKTWKEAIEDVKAWKRGEVRVRPGLRGRVYARKDQVDSSPNTISTNLTLVGEITPKRIWKAAEGKWYSIEEYQARFKETH